MKAFTGLTGCLLIWLFASLLPVRTGQPHLLSHVGISLAAQPACLHDQQLSRLPVEMAATEPFHAVTTAHKADKDKKKTFYTHASVPLIACCRTSGGPAVATHSFSPCFTTRLYLLYRRLLV